MTFLIIGALYVLLGVALVATSLGWNPLGSLFAAESETPAKGALEVLTSYLACELAPQGISVNGVNPGFVDTDSAHVFGDKVYRLLEKNIVTYTPLQRVG